MRDYFKLIRCRDKYTRFDYSNRRARSRAKREVRRLANQYKEG